VVIFLSLLPAIIAWLRAKMQARTAPVVPEAGE